MKLPKKVYLITALLLFIGGGGTVLALQPEDIPKKVEVQQVSTVEPQKKEIIDNVQPEIPSSQPTSAVEQPAPPTPSTPTTQPKYGQDPDIADAYVVFDKAWVVSQAGINASDFEYVNKIVRGWFYKSNNPMVNLCMAYPAVKMKTFGEDYLDNPVTQLKWCNDYITKRYGSWEKAAAYFDVNRGI